MVAACACSPPNLSRRPLLKQDLERQEMEEVDVVLTEIKAAAIDVVAEVADAKGLPWSSWTMIRWRWLRPSRGIWWPCVCRRRRPRPGRDSPRARGGTKAGGPVVSPSGGTPAAAGALPPGLPEHIRIVSQEHSLPFSKGILSESLTATGLPPQRAYAVAQLVEASLRRRESLEIPLDELRSLVLAILAETRSRFLSIGTRSGRSSPRPVGLSSL